MIKNLQSLDYSQFLHWSFALVNFFILNLNKHLCNQFLRIYHFSFYHHTCFFSFCQFDCDWQIYSPQEWLSLNRKPLCLEKILCHLSYSLTKCWMNSWRRDSYFKSLSTRPIQAHFLELELRTYSEKIGMNLNWQNFDGLPLNINKFELTYIFVDVQYNVSISLINDLHLVYNVRHLFFSIPPLA